MQQTSTSALIPQEIIIPQPSSFSKHLNNEQLALWLLNHPNLAGTDYEDDINKLKGTLHTYYGVWHIEFGMLHLNRSKSKWSCIC